MQATHLSTKPQTSKQNPLVLMYWDSQNVYLTEERANLLVAFAKLQGRLISQKIYYNSDCKNQVPAKVNLESIGFILIDVPCPLKNSADNQLIAHCIKDMNSSNPPDIAIIVSGDSDFEDLVVNLKTSSKKAIVVAQRGNVKQSLKTAADEFYFVDELPKLVRDNTLTEKVLSDIKYDDAVHCLLEAIKAANSQGKRAEYSIVDTLMRQKFPNYQGFSTILKPDGTKFSSFSKFVAAVVKDGKIKLQNQGMLLV